MSSPPTSPQHSGSGPSFREAFLFWLKLGFISFGGPTGQIAILHEELVERRRWISESRFLHALNYCMLLPGPEAQQLATYIGWLLHRTAGGIAAGALFVLPSAVILFALSWIYVTWGEVREIAAVFRGLQPAVLAIVAAAVVRIGRRALGNAVLWTVAGVSFIAIFRFHVGFPWIILAAALLGCVAASLGWRNFQGRQGHQAHGGGKEASPEADLVASLAAHARPTWGRAVRVLATCLVLWWAPVLGLGAWLGPDHTVVREGIFFSKAAMVTFGGAYAVLPYVSQRAVEAYGWLSAPQMLDGLGLAETTPGPLIMVLQFVGFLGGWNHPGELSPLAAAALGSFVSTWTTFLPCFLWIFLGAPHIEQLRGNRRLGGALTAVTAAVVGVVLNLAVWFGAHVLVPAPGRVDWISVLVAGVALVGLVRWKWSVPAVVLGGGLLGLARELLGA